MNNVEMEIKPATKVKVRVSRCVTLYMDVEMDIRPGADLNLELDRALARAEAIEQAHAIPIQDWKCSTSDYEAMLEDEF